MWMGLICISLSQSHAQTSSNELNPVLKLPHPTGIYDVGRLQYQVANPVRASKKQRFVL